MPRARIPNPIEKIDQQIEAKKQEIESLQRDREVLVRYLQNGAPRRAKSRAPKTVKATKTNGKPRTIELMQSILTAHKSPMHWKDLKSQLEKRGWKSESKDPAATILVALRRGKFKRMGKGMYGPARQ
jgi:hypothetical protein